MNPTQLPVDFPEVQAAIYRVALSLDSFLLNGIPYGVIHQAVFNGFLQKTARNLLEELASLQNMHRMPPAASQPKVREVLAALRRRCQLLIDLVTGLSSFRTLPLEQLRAAVSQVPLVRAACIRLLQELEGCFQTPKPFYESRPAHSTATVNDFLANLERIFAEEWIAASRHKEVGPSSIPPPILCPRCGAVLQLWTVGMQQQTCPLCGEPITR